MSPTNWKVWNFGVYLSFVVLGVSMAVRNIPGVVLSIVALVFLYRNHKQDQKEAVPVIV